VTRIPSAIAQGDPIAAEQLLPLVYNELRNRRRGRALGICRGAAMVSGRWPGLAVPKLSK